VRLRRFLTLTAVVHVALALAVLAHARLAGRDDGGRWALATLFGGVLGVAGYRRR
jgi:hypothetical protein